MLNNQWELYPPEEIKLFSDEHTWNKYIKESQKKRNIGEGLELYIKELSESSEVRTALRQYVNELPSNEKQIIYLRFWGNLSVSDICYELKLKRQTFYNLLERALDTLREKTQSKELFSKRKTYCEVAA